MAFTWRMIDEVYEVMARSRATDPSSTAANLRESFPCSCGWQCGCDSCSDGAKLFSCDCMCPKC